MDNHLSSVKNSCHLLKLFLDSPKELGVTEISRKLDMSKGAAHKMLGTLESEGFIRQNPANKQYSLGYTLLELGNQVLKNHDLVEFSKPSMQRLSDVSKEFICLCVKDGPDAIYVSKIESQYPIRFIVETSRRFPLYATSASRAILANQPQDFIDHILENEIKTYTTHSLRTPEQIKRRLAEIREQGYEFSANMRNVGVTGIAAPIFDTNGEVNASISLMGPTDRMEPKKEEWIRLVVDATLEISRGIGYRG
ncbi:IclR family transcriptional regulator [Cohnella lubricantis]|uniref:Glycerol operon regulatory protein n=1 Tax=Cohnella lubricantis TaxID=2163172 RepID=A0A841TIY1_9BACL|nr:IclR family transcriptional regulator [Cohnella lubricantis]MBB6678887.1 IclR family transcriptional regulator [Cohnella lubricantis]MBP2120212.1 DNA-binding IclR family transcriptional regulator [Cohnella lubricantis]